MNKQNEMLILRDNAKNQLLEIKTIESGKEYLNKVKAIETWVKAEKKDAELQNIVAEQKIRTQRILGNLIKSGQEKNEIASQKIHKGSVPQGNTAPKNLSDIGITRKESSAFKAISDIPDDIFEREITQKKDNVKKAVGELTTAGMLQIAKEHKKQNDRKEQSEFGKNKKINIDFRLGDFEKVLSDIPNGSVDCIITDPPYPIEFIECWTKLSRFAKSKLKPNGFCIAYSGQMNLPEVIKRMGEYLDYYWIFAVYHEGQTQIVNGVNLICRWKPVLIYQNGKKKLNNTMQDYFISEQREKGQHDWQQGKSGVLKLIEQFTNEGDLIVEPFAGGGTTIKASIELKRNIIAAEIDETNYNIAKANLK